MASRLLIVYVHRVKYSAISKAPLFTFGTLSTFVFIKSPNEYVKDNKDNNVKDNNDVQNELISALCAFTTYQN